MTLDRDSRNRASVLLVGVMFLALWVMIDAGAFIFASAIYIVIGIVSIFFYGQWEKIGRESRLEGISKNFIRDIFIGLGVAGGFIVLSYISPLVGAIGIPQVQSVAEVIGKFLIIVLIAPIAEELLFREFIMDFFESKLRLRWIVAVILQAITFSLFHLVAYTGGGEFSLASGAFISAFLAGIVFTIENRLTKSHTANIITHIILNLWIGFVMQSVA